jgi:hypothetical protein
MRSMPMLRDTASGLTRTDPTVVPDVCDRPCGQMPGQLKRHRFLGMQQLKSGRRAIEGSSVHKGRFEVTTPFGVCAGLCAWPSCSAARYYFAGLPSKLKARRCWRATDQGARPVRCRLSAAYCVSIIDFNYNTVSNLKTIGVIECQRVSNSVKPLIFLEHPLKIFAKIPQCLECQECQRGLRARGVFFRFYSNVSAEK